MKVKKILSLLTVVAMLFSAFAISVSAEPTGSITITPSTTSIKTAKDLAVEVVLAGTLGYVEMTVAYNTTLFTYVADSFATEVEGLSLAKAEAGLLTIEYKEFTNVKDMTIASFKLKACDDAALDAAEVKSADITAAYVEKMTGSGMEKQIFDKDGVPVDLTLEKATVGVVKEHTAPSIESVVMDPATGVLGTKITASTTGWADNWGLPEKTTYKWTIGEETVSETAEYTPVEADLGKELKVTATPTVLEADGAEAPFTGEAKSATIKVVPAADYAPTATVTLEKVTAGKEVELDYVINKYANGDDASTFAWYVVEAEDAEAAIAAAKEATPVEGATTANPTFDKENKGKWAVVEVKAFEEIGEVTYPTDAEKANVYYAAAEIKVKKSGASAQTGASLVTGGNVTVKPEEPVKPEDPEVPTEPEKDPEDPQGAANDKGAAAFTDVDKEAYAWAYDSIDTLAKAGVIKGMTETTFGPELTTTNAQVIALAVRIAGLTAEEGATTDKVDAEHWVAGEMAIADANEILAVFGDKVDVEGETTREIAFTLLYNALKAAGVELAETAEAIEYSDAASISEGCVEAIEALTKAGIVNGMGDGTLAPKATLTRAQLAKILGLAEALIK